METRKKQTAENYIKDIRRKTRRLFSSEQKIQIIMEAGKKRLSGDLTREATSDEVADLRKENLKLKETLADLVLRYDIVKKSLHALD